MALGLWCVRLIALKLFTSPMHFFSKVSSADRDSACCPGDLRNSEETMGWDIDRCICIMCSELQILLHTIWRSLELGALLVYKL